MITLKALYPTPVVETFPPKRPKDSWKKWRTGSPYFNLPQEILAWFRPRKYSSSYKSIKDYKIVFGKKSVFIKNPKGKKSEYPYSNWDIELHYLTPTCLSKRKKGLPRCYLRLVKENQSVIQAVEYDFEKFILVAKTLEKEVVLLKEYMNFYRAYYGKYENPNDAFFYEKNRIKLLVNTK